MGRNSLPISPPVQVTRQNQRQLWRRRSRRSRSPLLLSRGGSRAVSPQLVHSPVLPIELICRVADFLFQVHPPVDDLSILCSTKPRWRDVAGFMNASYDLHQLGFSRWISVLHIKNPEDWEMAEKYSRWVRELRCDDGALADHRYRLVLARFEQLHAVSIDAHSDVFRNHQGRFSYRDLFRALPPSLRRLEITRAHGPDARVIATVKEWCPNLEELRLGRCTIFNVSPACDFWRSFPFDHDSYMSNEDPEAYSRSLSKELMPLKFLKSLRMGLYLIPSATVLAHRIYHRRNMTAPAVIDWRQPFPHDYATQPGAQLVPAQQLVSLLHERDPESEFGLNALCTMCIETVEEVSKQAEAKASEILKEMVPSLEKMQWMNWFSPGHLGVSTYPRVATL